MDDTEIVAAVLARLAERIGSDRFELWFGAKVRLVVGPSTLTVQVPNSFHQNWLRRNFRRDLEAACQESLGRSMELEFRVAPASGDKPGEGGAPASDLQQRFTFDEDVQPMPVETASATAMLEAPPKRPKPAVPVPMSAGRRCASLQSFVTGSANRLAYAAAEMVAGKPGSVNPLFVFGPTGVGKTHLLEGLLSEARRLHPRINAVILTAEQFTTSFLEALRGGGLPNFRQKYRTVDLLIIDDVQFLAGKRATAVEFVHTFETLVRQGRQLVVAADRPPAELHDLGPELITRLSGGMLAKIAAADYATRLGIIQQRALALGLQLDTEVQEFVATHLTAHARELTGALHQLLAASRIRREPITKALAEEALGDLIQGHAKPVQFQQIERAVCEVFGLERDELQASRRAKALNAPRMVAMWLARKHTRAALSDIGQYFGRRSHSTVIAAQKTIGKWVSDRTDVQLSDKTCSAEQAIRLVEAKLRAG